MRGSFDRRCRDPGGVLDHSEKEPSKHRRALALYIAGVDRRGGRGLRCVPRRDVGRAVQGARWVGGVSYGRQPNVCNPKGKVPFKVRLW
jgi:hypothetical protein